VICEHDKLETRARGGRGNLVGAAQTVGTIRVNVKDAGKRAVGSRRQRQPPRRQGAYDQNSNGGPEGRRHH
jgi:hypothetical protein